MIPPCRRNPEGWFPPDLDGYDETPWYDSDEAYRARAACFNCEYTLCLTEFGHLKHGIVGGLSPSERKSIRDARTRR